MKVYYAAMSLALGFLILEVGAFKEMPREAIALKEDLTRYRIKDLEFVTQVTRENPDAPPIANVLFVDVENEITVSIQKGKRGFEVMTSSDSAVYTDRTGDGIPDTVMVENDGFIELYAIEIERGKLIGRGEK